MHIYKAASSFQNPALMFYQGFSKSNMPVDCWTNSCSWTWQKSMLPKLLFSYFLNNCNVFVLHVFIHSLLEQKIYVAQWKASSRVPKGCSRVHLSWAESKRVDIVRCKILSFKNWWNPSSLILLMIVGHVKAM
mgnify:CR=1 FL=1